MSLMKTLAKVAIGVAVAKGASAMMNKNKSTTGSASSGGGLGGLLGGLTGGSTGGSGGNLQDMLGGLMGGSSGASSGGLGGLHAVKQGQAHRGAQALQERSPGNRLETTHGLTPSSRRIRNGSLCTTAITIAWKRNPSSRQAATILSIAQRSLNSSPRPRE